MDMREISWYQMGGEKTKKHRQLWSQLTLQVGVAEESMLMGSSARSNLTTKNTEQISHLNRRDKVFWKGQKGVVKCLARCF